MSGQATAFEAYSYRVSARFGSRVQVEIADADVTIAGPRLSRLVYRLWISGQAVLLTSASLAVLLAIILWDWRGLLAALLLLLLHLAAGGFGAGCLWEAANLTAFSQDSRGETVTFPLDAVKRVQVGNGWARRGLWLLLLPYFVGINSLAEGLCVSFEAPDGETGREVVYALHMQTREQAQALAHLLNRGEPDD